MRKSHPLTVTFHPTRHHPLVVFLSLAAVIMTAGSRVVAQSPEDTVPVTDEHGTIIATLREAREYRAGEAAANCLIRGCEVFLGRIGSIGEPRKEPGNLEDDYAVFSRTLILERVEKLYPEERTALPELKVDFHREPPRAKTSDGPWTAWTGVEIRIGVPLLLFRVAPNQSTYGDVPKYHATIPIDMAQVFSDETFIARFLEIIDIHKKLVENPDSLVNLLPALSARTDRLSAAYLVRVVTRMQSPSYSIPTTLDQNVTAGIAASLIRDESIPFLARKDLVYWIETNFSGFSPPTRQEVTEAVMALGALEFSGPQSKMVELALYTLIGFGYADLLQMEPLLDPGIRSALGKNYRILVASGKLHVGEDQKGTRAFTKQFGIQ